MTVHGSQLIQIMFIFLDLINVFSFCFFLLVFPEEDPDSSVARARHRQKRGLLKLYYGVGEEPGETPVNPCDINGAHFKPDAYMEKLLKEKSLTELMDKETDITKRKEFKT